MLGNFHEYHLKVGTNEKQKNHSIGSAIYGSVLGLDDPRNSSGRILLEKIISSIYVIDCNSNGNSVICFFFIEEG